MNKPRYRCLLICSDCGKAEQIEADWLIIGGAGKDAGILKDKGTEFIPDGDWERLVNFFPEMRQHSILHRKNDSL